MRVDDYRIGVVVDKHEIEFVRFLMIADAVRQGVQQEIHDVWTEIRDKNFSDADRIDIAQEMERAELMAALDTRQHLYLWLALTDEALHFLLSVYRFSEENVEKVHEESVRIAVAFRSLLARMCALTVAVRRLVVAGLEDAARPVMRSWLETLDLLIVVLADEDFAVRYSSAIHNEEYDANEFWKTEIGYGRLNRRLIRALDRAEMTAEQKESFLKDQKLIKRKMSESVHSSLPSAMFSEVVPSLSRLGFYNRSILGHVSVHSPDLLSIVIERVHQFGVMFHKLLTSSDPPLLLSNVKHVTDCPSLHTAFFTLQEMVERYSEMLPPSSNPSSTAED